MGAPYVYGQRTRWVRRTTRGRRATGWIWERLEPRALLAAGPTPAGAEFRVNTHAAGSQELFSEAPHAVAASAAGDFVATWSSSGQDGGAWGVYAQRYASDGSPLGNEFRVNQTTANNQWYPTVALDERGNFVLTWTAEFQDGSQSGIYARRYDASGAATSDEFRVNTTTAGNQRHSTVAVDADGDFVVAWSGYAQPEGNVWDVYAQSYSASGLKRGGEIRVNSTVAGNQQHASVAMDADGDFVVAWTADGQDGGGTGAYARRYGASGAPRGTEFRINETTAGDQQYARVAAADGGDFVVAWASAGQDGSGRGVYGRRYDASGVARGGEFRVNETTAGEQFAPTVAADADGDFVITWTAAAQDGDAFNVYGRAYAAAGAARGGEFRVNTTTARNQVYSAVTLDADGDGVVVWESEAQDGSFFGIYGQRFAAPDTVPPTADVIDVSPDPRTTPVPQIRIRFTEPVTGFSLSDLTLTRDGGANLLTALQTLGNADGRTFTIAGLASVTALPGNYTLTVHAAASGITDAAENVIKTDASERWTVTAAAAVAGRYVFYNRSAYDGNDALPGPADDSAIAPDKVALLPGQIATFANYTNFSRGITGVMVDIAGSAGSAGGITTADFSFAAGAAPDGATWTAAPEPSVSVRPGAGAGGSDRVTLTWPEGVLRGKWLGVTVGATANTSLPAPDVFYFGNLPGETGDSATSAALTAIDFALTRRATIAGSGGAAPGPLPPDNRLDHNRDGAVTFRDVLVVRSGLFRDGLPLIVAPVAAPASPPVPSAAADLRGEEEVGDDPSFPLP